jgi:hypothetical protein
MKLYVTYNPFNVRADGGALPMHNTGLSKMSQLPPPIPCPQCFICANAWPPAFLLLQVYVTQPVIKSGCVLRRANVGVLERENLVQKKDVVREAFSGGGSDPECRSGHGAGR